MAARSGILGLGSRLYPGNMQRIFKRDLTRFMQSLSRERQNRASKRKALLAGCARLLAKSNPSKACGPDDVPNWLLREYSDLLAYPVCSIINASLQEQRLPTIWKYADVSPLPKKKKVDDLKKKKDLRPISLRIVWYRIIS